MIALVLAARRAAALWANAVGFTLMLGRAFSAPDEGGGGATAEHGTCPVCGGALTAGGWCNLCQLPADRAREIFLAQRLEEARTPCGVLVVLALVAVAIAAAVTLWAVL
jgi:hypothetical protein